MSFKAPQTTYVLTIFSL